MSEGGTSSNDDLGATLNHASLHYLFILFNCERPQDLPTRHLLDGVDVVRFGRGDSRKITRSFKDGICYVDVSEPDAWMSSSHAQITRGTDKWFFEDLGSKNGSLINGVRATRVLLGKGDLIELGHTFFTFRLLSGDDFDPVKDPPALPELTTLIPDLHRQFVRFARASKTGISLLLTGETGTGKEMLARAAHQLSGRSGRFMAINCGALASTVIEAELFGVRRGAFTGANQDRDGIIRAADGGTLFLDEIGELPLSSQTTFLRVLQEREVVPVGDMNTVKVDFRLVCATNKNLSALVAQDTFRSDLLSRISGYGLRVPALRDRREDLALLIPTLIARHPQMHGRPPSLRPSAMRALMMYRWPMNIRELEKYLEAAVLLMSKKVIDIDDLPEDLRNARTAAEPDDATRPTKEPMQKVNSNLTPRDLRVREELVGLLRVHGGNVSRVARAMGKGRNQIVRWMKRFNLDRTEFQQP